MGLFINNSDHPGVYKNNNKILEPNQDYYHKDYFAEMISEQKDINRTLSSAVHELKTAYQQQNSITTEKWQQIANHLKALRNSEAARETFESQATGWLKTLDDNNRKLFHIMQHDDVLKKDVTEKIESLNQSNQSIAERLSAYESFNQELTQQMNELAELNRQLSQQMSEQDKTQDNVLDRLESQEALMEKVNRQVSHFRSILFERSSYLAEKIEDSYHLTSTYFYKMMNDSEKPLTLYMDQKRTDSDKRRD